MATLNQIFRRQTIAIDIDTAWDFISSPRNLDAITPDDMNFRIITDLPEKMFNGLMIEYRIGIPLLGEQLWLTEIKHIREKKSFVDEQRIGPYQLWYHYHEIEAVGGGVQFTDRVLYTLPFGPLGSIAHAVYVKKQLQHVFDFRATAMPKLLEQH